MFLDNAWLHSFKMGGKSQADKGEETKSSLHFLGFILELNSIRFRKNMIDRMNIGLITCSNASLMTYIKLTIKLSEDHSASASPVIYMYIKCMFCG